MRNMIDNVRDVTDYAIKMAFLWNTTVNSDESDRVELSSYTRPWLIRILGKIRHC